MLNMVNFLALKSGAEIHRNPFERSTLMNFSRSNQCGLGHLQFFQSYRTYWLLQSSRVWTNRSNSGQGNSAQFRALLHTAMWVNHLRWYPWPLGGSSRGDCFVPACCRLRHFIISRYFQLCIYHHLLFILGCWIVLCFVIHLTVGICRDQGWLGAETAYGLQFLEWLGV